MKVIICCLGTRGDVEPLLALGKALQARGHAVMLCGPDNCASWVREEHALGFTPLGLDFKALMQSPEVRAARGGIEAAIGKGVNAAMPAMLRAVSDTADRVGVDLVVCSATFPGGPDLAEKHGAALVTTAMAPVFPTRQFPFFLASVGPFGRLLNRATYLMPAMARAMHGAALAQWRREELRLQARGPRMLEMGCRTDGKVAPRMCCISPSVIPQPSDWDTLTTMTGYWRLEDPAQWAPDDALTAFLAGAGRPVVYIGFGSDGAATPSTPRARTSIIWTWLRTPSSSRSCRLSCTTEARARPPPVSPRGGPRSSVQLVRTSPCGGTACTASWGAVPSPSRLLSSRRRCSRRGYARLSVMRAFARAPPSSRRA